VILRVPLTPSHELLRQSHMRAGNAAHSWPLSDFPMRPLLMAVSWRPVVMVPTLEQGAAVAVLLWPDFVKGREALLELSS
jgi:hypothetical protein